MVEWLLANKHLLPSMLVFFIGFIWVIKVPVFYSIRNHDISVLFNPARLVVTPGRERIEIIAAIFLIFLGIASQVLITKMYGYYFVLADGRKVFVQGDGLSFK